MFRKRRTILNGVELPEEFSGASVVNNVAISPDGKQYAYVSESGLIIGAMPADGKLKVDDGTEIQYKHGVASVHMRHGFGLFRSGIYVGGHGVSVTSIGGSRIEIGGSGLAYEINKSYDSLTGVNLAEHVRNVNLELSSDGKTHIQGFTRSEPSNTSGCLHIYGLEGKLTLPKDKHDLEIGIGNLVGNISGSVAHKGEIHAGTGYISLSVHSPLTIEARTSVGDVDVRGMISQGRGVYLPPNATPIGRLRLQTSVGDIRVNYSESR